MNCVGLQGLGRDLLLPPGHLVGPPVIWLQLLLPALQDLLLGQPASTASATATPGRRLCRLHGPALTLGLGPAHPQPQGLTTRPAAPQETTFFVRQY